MLGLGRDFFPQNTSFLFEFLIYDVLLGTFLAEKVTRKTKCHNLC
jgi:hypothetical protein